MNLEKMIAEYVDLGITSYQETFELQKRLAKKRANDEIPDTVLISEHYPVVNFGMRDVHNTFSQALKEEMNEAKIEYSEDNAIKYLKEKGIDFSRTSRGGGATFIGPGQINFYPIVKYEKIAQEVMGVDKYKEIIDSVMFNVLNSYGVNVNIRADMRNDDAEARNSNRKDIWTELDGRSYKLGGKGIHVAKGVAYHGFNLYLKSGSTKGFDYVNPCGYTRDELGTLSVEEALGREVSKSDFKQRVLGEIKEKFGYESLREGRL